MGTRAGRIGAVAAVALLVAAFGTVLGADESHADDRPGRVLLVLDSSGSMKEPAGGGETRIQAAKKALRQVVEQLPDDQAVGLRVYGAKVFSRKDLGACTDSQLVVKPATGNRQALLTAIGAYRPYGETPTGYALREAGKDVGGEGRRTIILVSDGEPTCAPDPCLVAKELRKQGIEVRIDVVGLNVNAAARKDLQCVARAGGGVYYDVDSSQELVDSLSAVAKRAARPYVPVGRPVTGTATPDGAPEIAAGDWLDAVDAATPAKHYRIKRALLNSSVVASAAYRASQTGGDFVDVELTTPSGTRCAFKTGVAGNGKLVSTAASASPYTQQEGCLTSPELVLVVTYRGTDSDGAALEIRVTEVPEVTDPETLAAPANQNTWTAPAKGSRKEVTGGTSFADAESIGAGSYKGTIVPGETLTFAIDATWGQQVDAAVHFPALRGGSAAAAEDAHTIVDLFAPSRAPSSASFTSPGTSRDRLLLIDGSTELASTTGTIAFPRLGSASHSGPAIGGTYFVTVYLQDTPRNASVAVPFELDVAAHGTPGGEPVFTEVPIDGASPSATPEVTPSATSGASPEVTPTGDRTDSTASSGKGGDGGGLSGISLILGGVGLAAIAAAAFLFLRRRGGSDALSD